MLLCFFGPRFDCACFNNTISCLPLVYILPSVVSIEWLARLHIIARVIYSWPTLGPLELPRPCKSWTTYKHLPQAFHAHALGWLYLNSNVASLLFWGGFHKIYCNHGIAFIFTSQHRGLRWSQTTSILDLIGPSWNASGTQDKLCLCKVWTDGPVYKLG